MNQVKHGWARFWSQTPKFLRKLRNICIGILAVTGAMLLAEETKGLDINPTIMWIVEHLFFFATGGAALIQFATTNKQLQEDGNK